MIVNRLYLFSFDFVFVLLCRALTFHFTFYTLRVFFLELSLLVFDYILSLLCVSFSVSIDVAS